MTDLEVMQHAKIYMEKLANGIDPVTDREAAEDDVIQNVRLSRCFFYVADVLRRLIEIGGMPQGGNRKNPLRCLWKSGICTPSIHIRSRSA